MYIKAFIIISFIFLSISLFANHKIYIAPEKSKNVTEDEIDILKNYFTDLLSKQTNLVIKTAKDREVEIVAPGLKTIVKLGKKKKVNSVITVTLKKISQIYFINVQWINVKEEKIIFSSSKEVKSITEFKSTVTKIVDEMFGKKIQPNKKPEIRKTKKLPVKKTTLKYFTGLKNGVSLPLDKSTRETISFDFPYICAFFRG